MSILARVLMLVACVPLLLPPGICVCKAGQPVRTSSPLEQVEARTNPAPAAAKPGCCSQPRCTAESRSSSLPPGDQSPAPPDDSHMPGCPASPSAEAAKWVEPTQSFTTVLPPLDVVAIRPVQVVASAAPLISTSTNWPSSPPLYLSHCSLVI